MTVFLCKTCGAESPPGIGYADTSEGPLPAPAPECPNPHAKVTTLVWVCTCCILKLANDDTSGCEFWENDHVSTLLTLIPEDAEVTSGMSWSEHADDCPNREAESWVTDCECETLTLSRSACAGCGSPLAGTRHAVTLWTAP